MPVRPAVPLELHVSRRARDRYRIDEEFLSQDGHVIFPTFHAARLFAQKLNARRDPARFPEQAVSAGELNAMGLIVEILHHIIGLYREQVDPGVMESAAVALAERCGAAAVEGVFARFLDDFPPREVWLRRAAPAAWLAGSRGGAPHRLVLLEELVMLWLQNVNPAFGPLLDLFDDAPLERATTYADLFPALSAWFAGRPPFGPDAQSLLDMLRAPALAVPHSLTGQLEYIRERWGHLLGERLWRLLSGLDLLREEQRWRDWSAGGRGPAEVLRFGAGAPGGAAGTEAERYSPDRDWMPRVVLLAKSVHVWLDQLAKAHARPISRLDEIPDAELDTLARWGFTGLWLIGVWERSGASQRIKQLCGNPDAVASAYSLRDYAIAADLGGEAALADLRARAWRRGIRLGGDMVPNHVGIDGRWVIEHPGWFVGLDDPPFPAYSFNGPDLSGDPRVGIFLEDHYYDRSDAAVVFKRLDRHTGAVRYIYHGNDGTGMPWNDTAQLNYLDPEVREAVTRTILHTASLFPIIRFDAAMTLTKRHYQRLWFPEPGTGGDIPSRAGQGLTRAGFDAAMPTEFWRDVVERTAAEAPDTLLLAEAFWLMEGYFVRTLGMHRVYNSAFMNMLKMEENAKYRQTLRNVLEFDPEILKRFVSFMNNPDEETAVAQFGRGDKYFGVCLLLATLPGLPMFGHGQVEGFTEKYGMEYRRAYRDERPDAELVRRHEREIFPLLHRRRLFAGVENFLLYDFHAPSGEVNEDVFAYSNREGGERALVLYHNRYAAAAGWIRLSTAVAVRAGDGRRLERHTLGEGLALDPSCGSFVVFRDQVDGLEYIRAGADLHAHGLYVELGAYARHAFVDFREVRDSRDQPWAELCGFLGGRGVPSLAEALRQICLQPIHAPLRALLGPDGLGRLAPPDKPSAVAPDAAALDEVLDRLLAFLVSAREFGGAAPDADSPATLATEARATLLAVLAADAPPPASIVPPVATEAPGPAARGAGSAPLPPLAADASAPGPASLRRDLRLVWALLRGLGRLGAGEGWEEAGRSRFDEWQLGRLIAAALHERGAGEDAAWAAVGRLKVLVSHQRWFAAPDARAVLAALLRDETARQLLGVNRWQDVLWLREEGYVELIGWLRDLSDLDLALAPATPARRAAETTRRAALLAELAGAGARAGWRVEALLGAD